MHISKITPFKIAEILWYFLHPGFFTNMTFIVSMILVYLKQIQALPYLLTLNLFILIIGSIISIFFVRNTINVAMDNLDITGLKIYKFSKLHLFMIFIGIIIHVIMTIILKWFIYKEFTTDEIANAELNGDNNRIKLSLACVCIVLLYFMTGLYKLYGMNTIGIVILFIICPPIMYICTYLDDYYFYETNKKVKK